MKVTRKIIWIILSCVMVLSLVLTSCTKEVEEEEEEEGPPPVEEEEEEEEEGPPTGDWWDKFGEPEYGGTINHRESSISFNLDPYNSWGGEYAYYGDRQFQHDWTLDREIWSFSTAFAPDEYWTGSLVESWEWSDPQTITAHVREGVQWQDKPPVNGREFTAYDIEHHYHRVMGIGSGYAKPSPFHIARLAIIEEVTATDKHIVVFKLRYPSATVLPVLTAPTGQNWVEAPELVTTEGGFTDWKYGIGTGPWLLTDYVAGSSETYSRNPNYWGYDPRHPQNQLPYADTVKVLVIPDIATAQAALRTGKIDMLDELEWEQAESLSRTNPELKQVSLPKAAAGPHMRVDKEPFTDIRVRKALNMAIDRKTIAETHYGGTVEGTPAGLISPYHKGWCFPYEEWSQELKDEYSYNSGRATQLLAEAGYPDGFKTNIVAGSTDDLELIQILKAYFMDIGVDMDVKVMDPVAANAFARAGNHDQMYWDARGVSGVTIEIPLAIPMRCPGDMSNFCRVNDPAYQALYESFLHSTSTDEAKKLSIEVDRYNLEQHWVINIFPYYIYNVYQPYLKGYSGENTAIGSFMGEIWKHLWIDQDLKKTMGY